ncbi:MAG: hypothetical protein CME63_16495 [Halobacteriovoraceae bacterium]|nr:hypothetical protein [Halobacteriovoraceae bacterium]|tara:strand:+ start:10040 stop:13762 length:3723 start_codon:yes stop_codon:yes gene_type:complete
MKEQSFFNDHIVELSSSFNRSTNLELDFDDTERLGDIYISSKFIQGINEVLQSVNEVNSNQRVRVLSGSPGLGKSTFALYMAHILNDEEKKGISRKINSLDDQEALELKKSYKEFNKSKSHLMPVFLNGWMGNIEDAFVKALKNSLEKFLADGATIFDDLNKENSKRLFSIISKWKKSYPQIHEKYIALLETENLDQKEFERDLKKGKTSAREVFSRIHLEVTGGVEANTGSVSAISLYKEVVKAIKAAGYNGIFVIYDEFGKYLEKGIHTPSALNIQFLQDFAEYCDRSGENQCHLTLITHMSVSQYASQLPVTVQKEWAKIEGRFSETSFYDRGSNYFKMISRVFTKPISETSQNLYKESLKRSKAFIKRLKGVAFEEMLNASDSTKVMANCYPLHPVTLAMLPFLSQKVAQNERTLYTFLTRDEDNSLKRFLELDVHGEESFSPLMPSHLYNYFSPLIAKDTGIGGAYKVSLIVEEAMNTIDKENSAAREILSVIALAAVIKNNSYCPMTETFFNEAFEDDFSAKEIKAGLEELKKKKALFFNRVLKQYELQQGSSVDINEEIENLREIKLTSRDLVKIVKRYFGTDYIAPKRYNFQNAVTRFFKTDIISVEELKSGKYQKSPHYHTEDGLLYFVLPFNKDEYEQAKGLILKEESELVLFSLPKTFIECRKDIEELNAINSLYSNKELISSSPLVKKELDRHQSVLLAAIKSLLGEFIGKFSLSSDLFYSKEKFRVGITHYSVLEKSLGDVFSMEYSKSIVFNSELVNKHKVPGAVTLGRKNLIDAMIKNPDKVGAKFGIQGNGPEVAIYKTLMSTANLTYSKTNHKLKISKDSEMIKSFLNDYTDILRSFSRGISYSELIDKLVAPPYGLRKGLVPLYVALFDQVLEHPVNHYFDGEYIPHPDGEHFELILKNPKLGKLHYAEISKAKLNYLKMLGTVFNSEDKASVSTSVAAILKWKKDVPEYSKSAAKTSMEGKKFLIAISSAKEPDRLVFKQIPEALGFEEISDKTKITEIKKIEEDLRSTKDHTVQVYQGLIKDLHASLIDALAFLQTNCLGVKASPVPKGANLAKLYQDNWTKFADTIRNHAFNKKTANFVNRFKNFDSSKHPFFFVETIADVLTGTHPRYWDKEGESVFNLALEKVVNEIEMVSEFLNDDFKGESAVAFINKESGEKKFLRLGVQSDLSSKQAEIKNKIEDLVKELSVKDRNNLLLDLLSAQKDQTGNVSVVREYSKYVE